MEEQQRRQEQQRPLQDIAGKDFRGRFGGHGADGTEETLIPTNRNSYRINLYLKGNTMSMFDALFHALSNPVGMLTDPIGTLVNSSIEDKVSSELKPEDIG